MRARLEMTQGERESLQDLDPEQRTELMAQLMEQLREQLEFCFTVETRKLENETLKIPRVQFNDG